MKTTTIKKEEGACRAVIERALPVQNTETSIPLFEIAGKRGSKKNIGVLKDFFTSFLEHHFYSNSPCFHS
jgi:hypothetical protein